MNTFFNSKLVRYGKRNESSKMGMIYGKKQFHFEQTITFAIMEFPIAFKFICYKNIHKTNFRNRINDHKKFFVAANWNLI